MTNSSSSHTSIPAPQAALLQAAYGAQTAQMLYIAAKLGIADQLKNGHHPTAELAHKLGVDASALLRVLRGLVSIGVCTESADGQFGLTSVGEYLRSDHPDSIQSRLLFNGEVHYAMWSEMLATVRTGEECLPGQASLHRCAGANGIRPYSGYQWHRHLGLIY